VVFRSAKGVAVLVLLLAGVACRRPDPQKELALEDVETYWVVDSSQGETRYLAPAVRFRVRNRGQKALHSVEATAVFRREGETQSWGSDWTKVAPGGKALEPNATALIVLRSDGRYFSTGAPESMFTHELFKDANVETFLRVGSSSWVKFVQTTVERRVGAHAAQVEPR
jgi:hypothetical protein